MLCVELLHATSSNIQNGLTQGAQHCTC